MRTEARRRAPKATPLPMDLRRPPFRPGAFDAVRNVAATAHPRAWQSRDTMDEQLVFQVHAIPRMAQRAISIQDVRHVLQTGEVIASYLDDSPYPSRLLLG